MLHYVAVLGDEYEREYLHTSRAQRLDEALNRKQADKAAAGANPETIAWSGRAWEMLQDTQRFPALNDLLKNGEVLNEYFEKPLKAVSRELRLQIAGGRGRSYLRSGGPTENLRSREAHERYCHDGNHWQAEIMEKLGIKRASSASA
jgi:hypothetical protein